MRTAVVLLLALTITACGSEREKSVPASAPNASHQTQTSSYSDCQSRIAIGSNKRVRSSKKVRRLLKKAEEAMESDKSTVLCASDVDYPGSDDEGWTPYAPLPGATSGEKRGKAQDFERAYPVP